MENYQTSKPTKTLQFNPFLTWTIHHNYTQHMSGSKGEGAESLT